MWRLSFLGNALGIVLLSMGLVFLAFARATSHFAKRVVGAFLWLLLYPDNASSTIFICLSLTSLGGYIQVRYFPHATFGPVFAAHVGVGVCVLLLGLAVSLLSPRVRVLHSVCGYVMGFVDIYRPGAPGRYGCFGEMGTKVGLLCGIAFLLLPFFVGLCYVYDLSHHDL
ncbi:hypothetical protein EI94DRAFT_1752815 [Lactarius quietus]|nr:hypothetical protein EI94DRAFT_1752815 [Lactarius quietus]